MDTDAPVDDVESLVGTTERYCVVLQTLANSPQRASGDRNGPSVPPGSRLESSKS